MSGSLAEAYPEQQARLLELIQQYQEIGPAGTFGRIMIEDVLRRANEAVAMQDVVAMIRCYKEMEGCK